jgi:LPXTG-motif cell wall-anchored protein
MRTGTAVAVLVISGFAWMGVPTAAADELPPTPAETGAASAPADEPSPEPTPEPSEVPTSDVTKPEPEASAAPTEEPGEPTGEEARDPAEGATTGKPADAADQPPPTEELDDDLPTAEEGVAVLAEEHAAVAEATLAAAVLDGRDPRAYLGEVNCTNMTVPVTLDNSRSTEAVAYSLQAGEGYWDENSTFPSFETTVQVAAGAVQVVNVPVTEDTQVFVFVDPFWTPGEDPPLDGTLLEAFVTVDCADDETMHDPQARIGDVDCAQMTVDVTLDNSRSEDETTYDVTVSLAVEDEPAYGDRFTVPAGEVQTIQMPVTENLPVVILVSVDAPESEDEGRALTWELFRVDCTPGDEPLASIGEVNCTNLTVPVTLDNTRSSMDSWFGIIATENADQFLDPTLNDYFPVDAGAERVVSVPVSNNAPVEIIVDEANQLGDLAYENFDVTCPRTAARPTVAVKGAKLPATGGFNLAIPLLGGALLAGGASMLALSGRRRRN